MLFSSTLDPNAKSTQELIVFCHADERVLLSLPKTYQDAQKLAQDEFSLSGELIFETTDLQGSETLHVRIHPSAWEGISPFIRSIYVKLVTTPSPTSRPRLSEAVSSGSRRLSSQKRISTTGAVPVRLSTALALPAQIVERQSISARKSPFPSFSSKPGPPISVHKEAGPSSFKCASPIPRSATSTPARIEELELDEEEEVRLKSPAKKRSTRPRIMSDYGLDEAEDDGAVDDEQKGEGSSEEDFDQLDDSEFASAGPYRSRPASHARGPASMSRSGSASLAEFNGPPSNAAPRKPERSSPVRQLNTTPLPEEHKIKPEKNQSRATPQPAPPAPSQREAVTVHSQASSLSQAPSNESFLVMIEYSDDPESRTLFKTRARHTVSKVLMQACRTFGLEDYYRTARLVLLVEEEEEDEDIVYQQRHVCDRNGTMGEAGAVPNAKFIVELIENDEE